MAKPIFIITIPQTNNEEMREWEKAIEMIKQDYHCILVSERVDKVEFKLFSDKEIEPIEIEKLKEILKIKSNSEPNKNNGLAVLERK